MKRTKERKQSGITLIALIITIIVMLILVSVTIAMAVNGGLFDYAGKATSETKDAIKDEQWLANGGIQIGDVYYTIDEYLSQVSENNGSRIKLSYKVTPAEDNLSAVITVNAKMLGGLIKGFEDYRTWALKKLEGKTPEEIEQIFVDGYNYMGQLYNSGEPIFNNIDEIVEYMSENYDEGAYSDVGGMLEFFGFESLADFAIEGWTVYPEQYEYFEYLDYFIWAKKQLQGKTDEEIEQIFVDGQNWHNEKDEWGDPIFNNIDEMVEYWLENWPDDYPGCEDIYDIMNLLGYPTLADMTADYWNVYPEKWAEQEEKLVDSVIHIMDPSGETWWETNTVEFTADSNGEYTFKATNATGTESNSVTVKIDMFGYKVGDYVNYNPDLGTYSVAGGEYGSGYDLTQSFSTDTSLKWRILSIDEKTGKLELISEKEVHELKLEGADGYNHGVDILNDLCENLYSKTINGKKVATARSIKIEDINKKTTYDYSKHWNNLYDITYGEKLIIKSRTESHPDADEYPSLYTKEIGFYIDDEKQLNGLSQSMGLGDGITKNHVTTYSTSIGAIKPSQDVFCTYTGYAYNINKKINTTLGINSIPEGLFDGNYIIATRGVGACKPHFISSPSWIGPDFGIFVARTDGVCQLMTLLMGPANVYTSELVENPLRPVVELSKDVGLTCYIQDSGFYWNLSY